MIPLTFDSSATATFKISEPTSPSKHALASLSLLELDKSSQSTVSGLSSNDEYSVQTIDETPRSIVGFGSLNIKISKNLAKRKKNVAGQQTLSEIVSERGYSKILGCVHDMDQDSQEVKVKEEKEKNFNEPFLESMEVLSKKRILEANEETNPLKPKVEETPGISQTMIKDEKLQPISAENEEIEKHVLEVVTYVPNKVTSSSFKKSNQAEKWSEKETKKFYRGLEIFGTDFSMVAKLFPSRNRNQIKNKFLKEERTAPKKIEEAFNKSKNVNFSDLIKRLEMRGIKAQTPQLIICGTGERGRRSGSFHSAASLDSIDGAIMEDLAEAFIPTKKLEAFSIILN